MLLFANTAEILCSGEKLEAQRQDVAQAVGMPASFLATMKLVLHMLLVSCCTLA